MKADSLFTDKIRVRVSALMILQNSIVLVEQQSPTRPGPIWLPPGGAIEPGENSRQALEREVMEETNLSIGSAGLKYIHEFIEPPYHAIELYFLVGEYSGNMKKGGDPELDPDNQQILQARKVTLEEAATIELYPEFLRTELQTGAYKKPGILLFN